MGHIRVQFFERKVQVAGVNGGGARRGFLPSNRNKTLPMF